MKKTMNKKSNVIFNTDPGVDDSVAMALSLYDQVIDIKLITTVNGNLDLNKVTRNCLHLLEKFGRTDIPVAMGAEKAMCRVSPNATFIHQHDGMGGYLPPENVSLKPIKKSAVEAMYETICENAGDISIISMGPHTNVGMLIKEHPDVVNMVNHIYCEGCAAFGNKIEGKRWSNYISFNASSDPEAMSIVFESGIPITIIPSRMGRELSNFTEEQVMEIRELNKVGYFFFQMYTGYWEHNYPDRRIATNDTCAVLALREPSLFKTKRCFVEIDTDENPGKTTMTFNKKGNVEYVYKVNRKRMHECFYKAIRKLDDLKLKK